MSDEEEVCQVCGLLYYDGCLNRRNAGGNILKVLDDGREVMQRCPNIKRKKLKSYLDAIDPQLWTQPSNKETPLFNRKEGIDRTQDNLFFEAVRWETFLANLKWVAAFKCWDPQAYHIKIITDMTLINVYVGNTSVKARLKEQLSDGTLMICNSLEDLLEGPDLVIIQLGHLKHANRAMANVLQEALMFRRGKALPTWLVEPHDRKFQPFRKTDFGTDEGMPCCSDDSYNYVVEHFETVELEDVEGTVPIEATPLYEEDEESASVSIGEESPSEMMAMVPEEETSEPESDVDADVDDLLGDFDKPKKKKWSSRRRR